MATNSGTTVVEIKTDTRNLHEIIETSWKKGHSEFSFLWEKEVLGDQEKNGTYFLGEEYETRYGDKGTLFRIILEDCINGGRIVRNILDNLVKKTVSDSVKKSSNVETQTGESRNPECPKCFEDKEKGVIQINFKPLFKRDVIVDELSIVRDLLDMQKERGDDKTLEEIFNHPVVETLILKKWERHRLLFYVTRARFVLFALFFTVYVKVMMVKGTEQEIRSTSGWVWNVCHLPANSKIASLWPFRGNKSETGQESFNMPNFFNCVPENAVIAGSLWCGLVLWQVVPCCWDLGNLIYLFCCLPEKTTPYDDYNLDKRLRHMTYKSVNAILLLWMLLVFCSPEILRVCLFGFWLYTSIKHLTGFIELVCNYYLSHVINTEYREPSAFLEIVSIVTVPVAIFWENHYAGYPLQDNFQVETTITADGSMEFRHGLVACGVWCAWLQLIFIVGMPSYSFIGDFITMFYNVIKSKLLYYIQVFFLLACAFGFAFWILIQGAKADEEAEDIEDKEMSFNRFFGSILLSITMTIGEFNATDFYQIFKGKTTKIFAMLFLVFLIILSTIAMLNLLVAAIISDYKVMKKQMNHQNLMIMAQYAIENERNFSILPKCLKSKVFRLLSIRSIRKKQLEDEGTELPKEILEFCPHEMCNNRHQTYRFNCGMLPLPHIRTRNYRATSNQDLDKSDTILGKILNLTDKRDYFCDDHKSTKNAKGRNM